MGCCFSRPDGPHSPYPGDPNTASARAINNRPPSSQQQPPSSAHADSAAAPPSLAPTTSRRVVRTSSLPSPPDNSIPVQSRRRSRLENQPLDQHINKPLRRHVWAAYDRSWSRASLDRERTDFFDTRVTGRPEVWQILHATLRVLWDPAAHGAGGDDDPAGIATAQGFLDAAELTLPTGDLAQGAYDSLGNYYPLPEWVVADPDNIIVTPSVAAAADDDEGTQGGRSAAADAKEDDLTGADDDSDDFADDAARKREEKGKAVVDVKDLVSVQARLSETSRDVTVSIGQADTARALARKVQEESGLPATKKIRIAYMGKILKDNVSFVEQGWQPGHVVNALVFNR